MDRAKLNRILNRANEIYAQKHPQNIVNLPKKINNSPLSLEQQAYEKYAVRKETNIDGLKNSVNVPNAEFKVAPQQSWWDKTKETVGNFFDELLPNGSLAEKQLNKLQGYKNNDGGWTDDQLAEIAINALHNGDTADSRDFAMVDEAYTRLSRSPKYKDSDLVLALNEARKSWAVSPFKAAGANASAAVAGTVADTASFVNSLGGDKIPLLKELTNSAIEIGRDAREGAARYNKGAQGEYAGAITQGAVNLLPYYFMGTGTEVVNTALNASKYAKYIAPIVKNPSFWYSLSTMWGNKYQEAIDNGADRMDALKNAAMYSVPAALVEVAGGIGSPNGQSQSLIRTVYEEIGEEIAQDIIDKASTKATTKPNLPIYSTTEDAIINPVELAKTATVTAPVVALSGGAARLGNMAVGKVKSIITPYKMALVYTQEEADNITKEGKTYRNFVEGKDISLKDFFLRSQNKRDKYEKLYLGKITQEGIKEINKLLESNGVNIRAEGQHFILPNDMFKHSDNDHGINSNETAEKVTEKTIKYIRETIYTPDSIEFSDYDDDGHPVIVFKKKVNGVNSVYVQFVHNKRDGFVGKTFYFTGKFKNKEDVILTDNTENSPTLYVRNDQDQTSSLDNIVPQDTDTVNNDYTQEPGNDANHLSDFEMEHREILMEATGEEITTPIYAEADPITSEQKQLAEDMKRAGLNITFFELTSEAYRGIPDIDFNGAHKNGHIYINIDAQNPYRVVAAHEVVHQIKQADIDSYNKLLEIVKNELGKDFDVTSMTEKEIEEKVADIMGDILDNPKKYNAVFKQNMSLGQKILTFLRDFISKLTGNGRLEANVSEYTAQLKNAEAELTKIMAESVKNIGANNDVDYTGETNHSIKKNSKGWYVQAEEQVIFSDDDDVREQEIMNYVKNKVLNKGRPIDIVLDNGEVISITGRTAWKLGGKDNYGDKYYLVKGNASGVIDEVVQVSKTKRRNGFKPPKKEHSDGFAINGFNYRTAYFRDLDGKYYRLSLSVGINADGKEAYNIGEIKEIPFPDKSVNGSKAQKRKISLNDTIPQKSGVVKPPAEKTSMQIAYEKALEKNKASANKYMQNSENNSSHSLKTSRLYDNTLQKEWTTEDTKQALADNKDRFMYEGITNKETYENAKNEIDTVGVDTAEHNLFVKQDWEAEDTAKALNLIARHQTEGDYERAVDVASVLRERLTKAGQAIQAAKIADRLTPEGQLIDVTRNAEKLVNDQIEKHPQKDKIKEELAEAKKKDRERKAKSEDKVNLPKKPKVEETPERSYVDEVYEKYNISHIDAETMQSIGESLNTISQLASKEDLIDLIIKQSIKRNTVHGKQMVNALRKQEFTYLKDVAVSQVFGMVADKYPTNIAQKLSTTQAMSHLLNAKTMSRNLVSNAIFDTVETVAYDVASVFDMLMGRRTGKRTVGVDKGWGQKGRLPGANKRGRTSYIEIGLDLPRKNAGSKYMLDRGGRTFKKGPMAVGERWLSYGLQTTDEWQKGAIEQSIRKSFEGLKNNGFTEEEVEELIKEEARYRTFQDDNKVSTILTVIKEGLNYIGVGEKVRGSKVIKTREFGLGDLVQKYTQVPGALISRSVEFTPLGYAKAIWTAVNARKNKNLTPKQQRDIALSLARGTTGSGLVVTFVLLSKLGVFIGEKDDEDKRLKALENSDGISGMQINMSALGRLIDGENPTMQKGDKLMSIGFLEPINTLMALGYDFSTLDDENNKKSDADKDGFLKLVSAVLTSKTFDQILDIPTMQTFRTMFDTKEYGGNLIDIAFSVASDAVTGFVPSPIRQAGNFTDPIQRYPYNEETNIEKAKERFKASLPILRKDVAAKVTPFGDEKDTSTGNKGLDFLNNFINPGNITQYTPSDISEELYEMSEYDTDVLPKIPSKSFKDGAGNEYKPKGKEYEEYSKLVGKATEEKLKAVINSAEYKRANKLDKAEMLTNAVNDAETEAKKQYAYKHGDYKSYGELELTYLSDSAQEKAKKARARGINADNFVKAYNAQKDVKGDKNKKTGQTILLSASQNKKKAIDKAVPNLSKAQKRVLYEMFDVSKKVW